MNNTIVRIFLSNIPDDNANDMAWARYNRLLCRAIARSTGAFRKELIDIFISANAVKIKRLANRHLRFNRTEIGAFADKEKEEDAISVITLCFVTTLSDANFNGVYDSTLIGEIIRAAKRVYFKENSPAGVVIPYSTFLEMRAKGLEIGVVSDPEAVMGICTKDPYEHLIEEDPSTKLAKIIEIARREEILTEDGERLLVEYYVRRTDTKELSIRFGVSENTLIKRKNRLLLRLRKIAQKIS